jgi:16S rRNA (cytosine1407-C5)-methyltransferase
MPKISYLDHISTLLPAQEVQAFQACYQQKLPKTIKVVTSKISAQEFKKIVEDRGWKIEKTIHSDCFYVRTFTESATLGQHFLHQGWFFYIQELSASMSAPLLDAQPWDLILDMCAAPGGKTVQLADTGAFVVANEPLNPRRKALIYNINRCWMYNTAVTNIDGTRFGKEYPELFDKILVDAPCSGEGMSYKTWGPLSRNEWLVKSLARTQVQLLESAIHTCKVWGIIVYSTCTLNEIENERVLQKIQETYGSTIELLMHKKYRPHRDKCGGFFLAKILKKSPIKTKKLLY